MPPIPRHPTIFRLLPTLLIVAASGILACSRSDPPTDRPAAGGDRAAASPDTPDPATPPIDLSGWQVAVGEHGLFRLAWRPKDRAVIPRNEDCQVEVLVLRDDAPCAGARVAVSGWMPDHNHGLVQVPVVTELGEGRYLASGVLLHMRGHWQLTLEASLGAELDVARFDLDL